MHRLSNTSIILGIMSGTSLDGVDYALCQFPRGAALCLAHWHVPFPQPLRRRLRTAAAGQALSHEVAQLHHDLGRFYATGSARAPRRLHPHAAGLHGQTVFHHPNPLNPATFQLGEPTYLAAQLNVPVVFNFRAADLALGGQGAPLATAFHVRTFAQPGAVVAVNNLGGISNVTWIDRSTPHSTRVLSFDTGPANLLLDLAIQQLSHDKKAFDRNGRLARRGRPHSPTLQRWLSHPFFSQPPPKSTGREQFGETFLRTELPRLLKTGATPADILATLTELTACSIADNYRHHLPSLPDRVLLAGGGANNPFLVERIQSRLRTLQPALVLQDTADLGWPSHVIEPAAFAWLAHLRLRNQPANLPETTGASRPALLGQIASPP